MEGHTSEGLIGFGGLNFLFKVTGTTAEDIKDGRITIDCLAIRV